MNIITDKLWLTELKVLYLVDFTSVKACSKLLNPDWFSLILVVSGTVSFSGDSFNIRLSSGDMSTLPNVTQVKTMRLPLRICFVSCTRDFEITNRVARFGTGYIEVLTNQSPFVLSLTKTETADMVELFGLLKKNIQGRYPIFQNKMILLCFELILYKFSGLCHKYGENVAVHSRNEIIVMSFIVLVQQNCKANHDVKFYADSLFVSKGHLRKVVSGVIGMSAKRIIEMAVISVSYELLANDKLSITEIGEQLNFSSCASFSGFFKRQTKLTPSQYRINLKF